MRLIVGLANPGSQYAATRHNAGAWFVEALAKEQNIRWQTISKFHAHIGEITSPTGQTLYLAIPTTFMNHSGQAIAAIANFYKILPQEILVAHDELDLPVGTVRLKLGGGHGGHNGLRSTMDLLHSRDFYRLRLGIGHPGVREQVTPYVLGTPTKGEQQAIHHAISQVTERLDLLFGSNLDKLMQQLNTASKAGV
ncbi:MAG: aminoacyl-tRNA hydrolase [Gammaproteobacteria bacterium]